jgi:hypothetical protein
MTTYTVDEFLNLGSYTGAYTISDSAENINALDSSTIATLGANGVTTIEATDPLTLTETAYSDFSAASIAFSAASDVTLSISGSTAYNLNGTSAAAYVAGGIDVLDVDVNYFSPPNVAAALAIFETGLRFASDDIGSTGASRTDYSALSSTAFVNLYTLGIRSLSVYGSGFDPVLDAAAALKAANAGLKVSTGSFVVVTGTAEDFSGFDAEDFIAVSGLAQGLTLVTVTSGVLELSMETAVDAAEGGARFSGAGTVTLIDTAENIATLSATQIALLKTKGIDDIDASGTLQFSAEQISAFITAGYTFDDAVTLVDSASNITTLTGAQLAEFGSWGVDTIDATDTVTVSLEQLANITDAGLVFADDDTVTLVDSASNITALTGAQLAEFGSWGVDTIDATDTVTISLEQLANITDAGIVFADDGTVVIYDTAANIAGYSASELGNFAAAGVDTITTSSDALTLTLAQAVALIDNGAVFGADMDVTIEADGDSFVDISATTLGLLFEAGVDAISVTGNDPLDLTVAQALAIVDQDIALTAENGVVIADTPAALSAISSEGIAALVALQKSATFTVTIDATGTDSYSLSLDAVQPFFDWGITFAGDDTVNLQLDLTGYLTNPDIQSYKQLAGVDTVTLRASSTEIAALTFDDVVYLPVNGVTTLDSTDDIVVVDYSKATAVTAGGLTFASGDLVTMADTGSTLRLILTAEIARIGAMGVDRIDATDNAVSFTLEQANAISEAGLKIVASDVATLAADSSDILELTAGELEILKSTGFDLVDTTENALSLTVAQATLFTDAGIGFASDDSITLINTAANIAMLGTSDIAELADADIDLVDVIGNTLSLNMLQAKAFGIAGLAFASEDVVSVVDTGASLKTLTATQIGALGDVGIDRLNASDNKLPLTTAQANALDDAGITVISSDTVTLADTGKRIGTMSLADIKHLTTTGIDIIDASDNAFTLTTARYEALGKIKIAANDTLSVVGDGGADKITAAGGTTLLYGKGGADVLYGVKAGADTFVFDTKLGAGNIDRIHGFDVAKDHIGLDDAIFKAIGKSLSASELTIGNAAKDGSDHFIYNDNNGKLFYDADGKGGSAQVQFALLDKGLHLTVHDFDMI